MTHKSGLTGTISSFSVIIPKTGNTKLIVSYSDKRAAKDGHNRKRGLERLEKQVKYGKLTKTSINNRGTCKGTGYIEEHNPAGIRVAVLVARKIKSMYPQFRSWEEIYSVIVVNISNAVNVSTTSAMWAKQHTDDPAFEDDTVFSEDPLTVDPYLEKLIEKGNYLEEAKIILGIHDK